MREGKLMEVELFGRILVVLSFATSLFWYRDPNIAGLRHYVLFRLSTFQKKGTYKGMDVVIPFAMMAVSWYERSAPCDK